MNAGVFPDPSSRFGRRVRERLRDERIIWLTTVSADGTPQPNPVWFIRDGDDIIVYNHTEAHRLPGIPERPQVSLHLNSDDSGDDVVVLSGRASFDESAPLPHHSAGYLAKYEAAMMRVSGSLEAFSQTYSVALRVRVTRVRGY